MPGSTPLQSQHRSKMAALSSPLRVCRGILKELRAIQGPSYKKSLAYNYVMDQFRKNKVSIPVNAQSLMLAQLLTTAALGSHGSRWLA